VPESYLHYRGLEPDQHSWYWNRRRESVSIHPGDWVRLDVDAHPEVRPAIQAGTAIIEAFAPQDVEILDDSSQATRDGNTFPPRPPRRPRGRSQPEVYGLTIEQLGRAVRCFLPWPGWQAELDRFGVFSEARAHRRGARPSVTLPMPFDMSFPILHRVAELIYRCGLVELRQATERNIESSWASGVYDSKRMLRKIYKRRMSPPPKRESIGKILRVWNAWSATRGPAARTLRRSRAALGVITPIRTFADEQILEVLKNPCQRIFLGPGEVSLGAYVPGRAAAAALTTIGPTLGPVVLDIRPPYDGILQPLG
jgi:hypothetical protein